MGWMIGKAEPCDQKVAWILQPFSASRLCLRLYAHWHRRLTASAVSDRASLESACHALAIGCSLRRHRLATSRGYRAPLAAKEITAGEKNRGRQHDREDHPQPPRQPEDVPQ